MALFNNGDGRAALSRMDLYTLRRIGFPEEAEQLIEALRDNCQIPSTVRLFTRDTVKDFRAPSCQDVMFELVTHAKDRLGLKATYDELGKFLKKEKSPQNNLDKMREAVFSKAFEQYVMDIRAAFGSMADDLSVGVAFVLFPNAVQALILSEDFRTFARFARETYGIGVFSHPSGIGTFLQPRQLAACQNPDNAVLFARLDRIFHFDRNHAIDFETLERLRMEPDFDQTLKQALAVRKRLASIYGDEAVSVRTPQDLERLVALSRDGDQLDTLSDSRVRDVARSFEYLGYKTHLLSDKHAIERLRKVADLFPGWFNDGPGKLKVLKAYGSPDPSWAFVPDIQAMQNHPEYLVDDWEKILDELSKPELRKLAERYPVGSMHGAARLVKIWNMPNRDRILVLAYHLHLRNSYELSELATLNERGLRTVETMISRWPRLRLRWFDGDVVRRLSSGYIRDVLERKETRPIYDRLVSMIGNDAGIGVDQLIDIAEDPIRREHLFDEHFLALVKEAVLLLANSGQPNVQYIVSCFDLAEADLNLIISADSRRALTLLRQNNPRFRIESSDAAAYAVQLRAGYSNLVSALESSGLLTDAGLFPVTLTHQDIVGLFLRPNVPQYAEGMFQSMGGDKRPSVYTVPSSEGNQFLSDLADPATRLFLDELRREKAIVLEQASSLPKLAALHKIPEAARRMQQLRELVGRPLSDDDLPHVSAILEQEQANTLLADESFLAFCRKVGQEILVPHGLEPIDIYGLAEFYARPRIGRTTQDVLDSESFKKTLDLIRQRASTFSLRGNMLGPIEDLSAQLDFGGIERIAHRLGQAVSANDLGFLNQIAREPELAVLLTDRRRLEEAAKRIYAKPPVPRKMLNQYVPEPDHTERTPVSDIDSLGLLRLVLLARSLDREEIRREIGQVVARDMSDEGTEYGGIVTWGNGSFHFNNVNSISEEDGSYENMLNGFLSGGPMTFHLHALTEDERNYAGPSGDVTNPFTGGDWGVARILRHTDVVITTLGRSGRGMVKINVDLYYVDSKGKPIWIDLGEYQLPLFGP